MYKNYGRNMRYWKPVSTHYDAKPEYPFVMIGYREMGYRSSKTIIKGNYPENQEEVSKIILDLTRNKPEGCYVLTAILVRGDQNWQKILQKGGYKKKGVYY